MMAHRIKFLKQYLDMIDFVSFIYGVYGSSLYLLFTLDYTWGGDFNLLRYKNMVKNYSYYLNFHKINNLVFEFWFIKI